MSKKLEPIREEILAFINSLSIFSSLRDNTVLLKEIITKVQIYKYYKGEHIYSRGDLANKVYIVHSGEVEILRYRPVSMKSQIIGLHGRGSLFGEVSLLAKQSRSSNAISSLDSIIYEIDENTFQKLISLDITISNTISKLLSSRLRSGISDFALDKDLFQIHSFSYPNAPRRGSELCSIIARWLVKEGRKKVLLIIFNEETWLKKQAKIEASKDLFDLLKMKEELNFTKEILNRYVVPFDNYDIIFGNVNKDNLAGKNISKLMDSVTVLLGYFRSHYDTILIDLGAQIKQPILTQFLSQSNTVVLAYDPNSLAKKNHLALWKETMRHANIAMKDFFEKSIILSDESERGVKVMDSEASFLMSSYNTSLRLYSKSSAKILENEDLLFLKCIRSLVRLLCGTSRGIVFSGGGARALVHLGVLQILENEEIEFDAVSASSMGAIIACLYAMGKSAKESEKIFKKLIPNSSAILDPTIPLVSFFRGKKIANGIKDLLGDLQFNELGIPFYCSTSDLATGESFIFDTGDLFSPILASVSLPGAFPPIKIGEHILSDGGILNNLPAGILRKKGYSRVIGSYAHSHSNSWSFEMLKEKKNATTTLKKIWEYISIPPIIHLVDRCMHIQSSELTKLRLQDFNYLLRIPISEYDIFAFEHIERIISVGKKYAAKNIEDIRRAIT